MPALFVRDIEVSRRFYTGLLELTPEIDMGKNIILKEGITIWEINPAHLIPQKLGYENLTAGAVCRFEIYFETDDIDAVFLRLKNYGVKFLHETHEETWGQMTIRFFDPDGHLIEIGEEMAVFLWRLYKNGLTVEEISSKTSVPVEDVKRFLGIKG